MNPDDLHHEAEAVWNATRPALHRRRRNRRQRRAAAALLAVGGLVLLSPLPSKHPSPSPPSGPAAATSPLSVEDSSLAVLVIDDRGARFEQLSPGQAAGAGLQFELTLAPVVTGSQATY